MYYKIRKYQLTTLLFFVFLLVLFSGTLTQVRAEENSEAELNSFLYPDDPYNDTLWAYDNPGFYTHYYGTFPVTRYTTADIDMNIWDAWEIYPLAKEETRTVLVAIIDTGVDYRHPDLADHMWVNPNEIPDNGIDDDANGYTDDIHGWDFYNNDSSVCHYTETVNGYTSDPDDNDNHGTHVAGIIASASNNGIGISGIASNVNIQIMSLKIHGGSTSSGSVANAIKAIRYAEEMGADICNLSWGTTNYSQALELTIRESSMLFITAAGNNGINNNNTPMFPASLRLPNLLSVAFVDSSGSLDPESNYGDSTVDIAAPGQDIYSTLVGSHGYSSGSSMAAPHVTGLAAMIYAYRDDIYPSQVKELIINTLTPLDSLNGSLIHPGIPNALEAIRSLPELQADASEPFLVLTTSYSKDAITVTVNAYDTDASGIRKVHYTYGAKPAEFFSTGGSTAILGDTVSLTKEGYYTFYAEDYAGNHTIYNYYVEDDNLAPEFEASCHVASDYSDIMVSFSASDPDSGLKTIKYLPGEFGKDMFLFNGEILDPSLGQYSLTVTPDVSAISFYVADYRGNSAVHIVPINIIPATALYLNITERSLHISETFQLQPLIFPWLSTDGVSYISYNNSVVAVDQQGLVTALTPGEAYIQVETYSGVSAFCRFLVTE